MRETIVSVRQQRSMRESKPSKRQASVEPSKRQVELAELTTKARKKLPKSAFAIPEDHEYPIHDETHARNALARVSQHGTPQEKARVRAAVARKYPNMMAKHKKMMK